MVNASQVKELREKTGAGMMDCKKVLTETDGDMEKAMDLLRERGITKAAKKSSRIAAEGLVDAYVSEDGKVGAVVEVNAETDFVAKNDEFKSFVADIAKQVATNNPSNVEDLLEQNSISDPSKKVKEVLVDKIAKIGENMSIRRFDRFESNGIVAKYIHGDGKIGVLVDMENANNDLAKDICLQIAAAKPEFLNEEDVPSSAIEKEKEIARAEAINANKPANIIDKMVEGKVGTYYKEVVLNDQAFVKDPNITVGKLVENSGAKIVRFARIEKGEGLEKKEENFAEEVAKQLNS